MATVPTPTTQGVGAIVNAATINSQGNLATYLAGRTESGGALKPVFVGRQTVSQSLVNATNTALTFDVENLDRDNGHSTVTNTSRYTAATAGWYQIGYTVAFASNATGARQAWFQFNGAASFAAYAIVPAVNGFPTVIGNTYISFMNGSTDYVEVFANQNSGGALNSTSGAQQCAFWAVWISV